MSETRPRIAIGMPVRNGERGLERALRSLLAQTEPSFTILVSDNASSDATPAILDRFAREDARISISRLDTPVPAAENFRRVLTAAPAPHFMWASHDDEWSPDFLAATLGALSDAPSAAACTPGVRVIDEVWRRHRTVAPPVALADPSPSARIRALLRSRYAFAVYGLFRRDRLHPEDIEVIGGADLLLLFRVLLRDPIVTVPESLLTYRIHGVDEKLGGEEAHLYTGESHWELHRAYRRAVARARLSPRESRAARRAVAWSAVRFARRAQLMGTPTRTTRALRDRRYGTAVWEATKHVALRPKAVFNPDAWRRFRDGLRDKR